MNGVFVDAGPSKTVILSNMKRIGLFCALLLLGLAAGAQKVYFVYVQSDNGAPFYVRLADKVASSTSAGYVILSGLRDSSYLLQVGFPGSSTESRFPVTLNGEDKGYVLKQVSGAWNLFDLQSLGLIKALAATGPSEEESRRLLAAADPFTRRLVEASDDLTLLGAGTSATVASVESLPPAPIKAVPEPEATAVVKTETPKTEAPRVDTVPATTAIAATKRVDTVALVAATQVDTVAVVAAPPAIAETEEPFRRSLVTRRSESSTTEGFGLVFIDKQGELSDTIRLLIPNPKFVPAAPAVAPADSTSRKQDLAEVPHMMDTARVIASSATPPEGTINTTQPVDTMLVAPAAATVSAPVKDTVLVTPSVAVVPASGVRPRTWTVADINCKAVAEQKDFLKLRKNLAAADDEPEMVVIARKEFNKRCYTVAQLRLLGTLFLTDLGRYHFFESSWNHVADQHNFPELESELKDGYLSQRLFELSAPKGGN